MWQGVDKYRCYAAVIIKALDNYYNSLVRTTQLNETKSNRNKTICSLKFHVKIHVVQGFKVLTTIWCGGGGQSMRATKLLYYITYNPEAKRNQFPVT